MKAFISKEEFVKSLNELHEQEISLIKEKMKCLEENQDRLPENIPFVIISNKKEELASFRNPNDWLMELQRSISDYYYCAKSIENNERVVEGYYKKWIKED